MDYNIFKDEKEKEEARLRLGELMEHPGWKIVVRALEKNLEAIDEQLDFERADNNQPHTVNRLLDRRVDLRSFKILPRLILKDIQPEPVEEEQDDDEYEQAPPAKN